MMSPTRVLNKRRLIAVHLLAMPMVLWAQVAPTTPPTDWKRANEAVAEFPRGHVDILKWEGAKLDFIHLKVQTHGPRLIERWG